MGYVCGLGFKLYMLGVYKILRMMEVLKQIWQGFFGQPIDELLNEVVRNKLIMYIMSFLSIEAVRSKLMFPLPDIFTPPWNERTRFEVHLYRSFHWFQ